MKNYNAAQSPEIITLVSPEGLQATINVNGAYIESLQTVDGFDLLFPRTRMDNGKDRGGLPICAPVFGPGDKANLGQHGFARNLQWRAINTTGENSIDFELVNPREQDSDRVPSSYSDLLLGLNVQIETRGAAHSLIMSLHAENLGSEDMVYTPGFHPYFKNHGVRQLQLQLRTPDDSHVMQLDQLDPAFVLPKDNAGTIAFNDGRHDVYIASTNMPYAIVWSDSPAQYFCVESTTAEFATAADSDDKLLQFIKPGMVIKHAIRIDWSTPQL